MPPRKSPAKKVVSRKPAANRVQVNFRATPEQIANWERAAKRNRRSVSDWMRITLDDEAESVSENS